MKIIKIITPLAIILTSSLGYGQASVAPNKRNSLPVVVPVVPVVAVQPPHKLPTGEDADYRIAQCTKIENGTSFMVLVNELTGEQVTLTTSDTLVEKQLIKLIGLDADQKTATIKVEGKSIRCEVVGIGAFTSFPKITDSFTSLKQPEYIDPESASNQDIVKVMIAKALILKRINEEKLPNPVSTDTGKTSGIKINAK